MESLSEEEDQQKGKEVDREDRMAVEWEILRLS